MKPLPRIVVFLLASTSIASLLGEMYRLWLMRFFTLAAHLIFGITMGLTSVGLEKGMAKC